MSMTLKAKPATLGKESFLKIYGAIYEHSPWIALGAYENTDALGTKETLNTVAGLHSAMQSTLASGSEAAQMALICAHPDLAGKLAIEDLTEESRSEQKGAGLDKCTDAEFEEFQTLNTTYKKTFGFPFIIAVKGLDRHDILAAFRARIHHNKATEFKTAIEQINRIAYFRLVDLAE